MSTQSTTLKGHAGTTGSFAGAIANGLSNVAAYLALRAERSRVVRELSAMSDRDLADIGIARAEIARVAGLTDLTALTVTNGR